MKTIRAKINKKTGKVTIETEGYEGATCLDATKKLEEGLGLKEPDRELKQEFYVEQSDTQQIGGA
jgi:hypothetical protein